MPQDNIKSAVYRSLKKSLNVPYGVSDETGMYGTNRKSSTYSPLVKPFTTEKRMNHKDPLPLRCKEEKAQVSRGISELDSIASSHLWQVSEGAEKLNQMADSWPERMCFGRRSIDIANDLLRGASDLQESLIILGKLQEASISMAGMKRKQKPNVRKEEEFDVETMGSNRLRNGRYPNIRQAPRVSLDGSSRSRTEELQKVIRDNLYRQNLASVPSVEERNSSGRRSFNSFSDGSRESSNRSMAVTTYDEYKNLYYDQKPSMENSKPAASVYKAKRPNLIAKLMGLEDFPSETVQTATKQIKSKTCLYPHRPRPNFDIDMPKTRKVQFKNHDTDPERKTLKEIIDAMQFKGLLKSNCSNDFEIHPHDFGTSKMKRQGKNENLPPIVIIRPLHLSCSEREIIEPAELIRTGVSDASRITERSCGKDHKILETIVQESTVLASKRIVEKLEAKELKIKEAIVCEDGVPDSKQVLKKMGMNERKIVETAYESSKMIKAASGEQKKKEAFRACKKVKEVQKAKPDRKSVEESTKSVIASRSQVRATSTKSNRHEKGTIPVKNHSSCEKSALQNRKSAHSIQSMSRNSMTLSVKNQIKKGKQDGESPAMNSIDLLQSESADSRDDKEAVSMLEISCMARTLLEDQLPLQIGQDDMKTKDCSQENPNSTPNVVPDPFQCRVTIECTQDSNHLIEDEAIVRTTTKTEMDLKQLLLSSPSFLSCAEEIYNINQPMFFQSYDVESGKENTRILLDCANELMTRKSHRMQCPGNSLLWTHMLGPKVSVSMDQSVEELIDEIENLRSYSKIGNGVLPTDSLYTILGRDLTCRRWLVNGVWDLGWVNGFLMEDVEQVIGEVEKVVLSSLIEEVITDFVY